MVRQFKFLAHFSRNIDMNPELRLKANARPRPSPRIAGGERLTREAKILLKRITPNIQSSPLQ